MSSPDKKLLAIGLEAAEPTLIEKWIEEGKLPNIQKIYQQGSYRRLSSCTEISSGATWASLLTGTNPGKHGMAFYHRQLKSGTYKIVKKYADDVERPPLWDFLVQDKKRVCILDIPSSYPSKQFSGAMIVGWGAEGLNYKRCSYPENLIGDVKRHFGRHPLEGWYQKRPETIEGWKKLAGDIVNGTRLRNNVYLSLLKKEDWHLFFAGFAEPHWIGHFFWFLRDPNHPDYDEKIVKACGDVIYEVYKAIDEGIEIFLETYPDCDVLIFSNTGMGSNYSGLHLMPEVINKLNLGNQEKQKKEMKLSVSHIIKRVENMVGIQFIEAIKSCFPERLWDSVTRNILDLANDWDKCKVFEVPTDYSAALRFNLKGREPKGMVQSGNEYNELFERIKFEVLQLVDSETGEKVVEEVIKVNEKYHGDNLDELPDMVIRWKGDSYIKSIESPNIGKIESKLPDKRTGAHTKFGFIVTSGPSFSNFGKLNDADILDIAPTILSYFGQSIPEDFDGCVLDDMIKT